MIEQSSSFSRARTLLQRLGSGRGPTLAGTGEADVFLGLVPGGSTTRSAGALAESVADPQRNLGTKLDRTLASIEEAGVVDIVRMHEQPARSGAFGAWPDRVDDRLLAAATERFGPQPYAHQAEALQVIADGGDVVLATSTASGKSMCFQVPIVGAALDDPGARALMMFPTKALARDQVESLRALIDALPGGPTIGVGPYDGDTPPEQRRAARSRAHAVATNPDMLHRGILPHHERWASFLAGLKFIVLDELHTYRGVFGGHVANVLRRLWRVCRHYGATPQVIACSATIGNPGPLAEALCPWLPARGGITVVDRDTAPAGKRTFVVANPRVVDATTGVRRDYTKVTRVVASSLLEHGVTSLVFCRTRKNVELLTRYLRDDAAKADEAASRRGKPSRIVPSVEETRGIVRELRLPDGARPADRVAATRTATKTVRGYRGGYLPELRRGIEQALREGEATMVASTNALELGMDIGGVDAVVLSGYPGTRAATLQRAGRAGRRGRPSLTICVLSSTPLDQFVANEPEFLFGQAPEQARIDPDNPELLLPHLRCAAHELPMQDGDALPGLTAQDVGAALEYLARSGALHAEPPVPVEEGGDPDASTSYHALGPSPAEGIDLRGSIEENFSVIDDASGDILAEVDYEDAPLYLHPGAIYGIEGRPHEVRELDWDARKARVRRVNADYYTEAVSKTRVRVVDPSDELSADRQGEGAPPSSGVGYAQLVRTVPGFKKIRLNTHENIGFGPITLPDLELQTTAAYWGLPPDDAALLPDPRGRASAMLAAAHAMHHVAAMLLMCDVGDLGHAVTPGHPGAWGFALIPGRRPGALAELDATAQPYVVLYDRMPGGAGLATAAHAMGRAFFERVVAVVAGCKCAAGCPTCMGPMAEAAESYGGTVVGDEDGGVRREDVVQLLAALAGVGAGTHP